MVTLVQKSVAFDLDGTLLSNIGLHTALQTEYPTYKEEFLTDYDIRNSLLKTGVIKDVKEYSNSEFFTKHGDNVYYHTTVFEDLLTFIKKCVSDGDTVIAITARPESEYVKTRKWLNKLGLKEVALFCTGFGTKKTILEENNIEYFFEDKYETVVEVSELPCMRSVFLLDYPYNQGVLSNKAVRVTNWGQALEHIQTK